MALTVRLALRDWDWLTPILLGDIKPSGFTVAIERVGTLIGDLASDPGFDGAEMSFSRYAQRVLRAEAKVVALPHFLMRGFRHRCIITSKASTIDSLEGLAGKAIGLAGWQDSGNTWTRALLRRKGVGVPDARWWLSRLSAAHPITVRMLLTHASGIAILGPIARPMPAKRIAPRTSPGPMIPRYARGSHRLAAGISSMNASQPIMLQPTRNAHAPRQPMNGAASFAGRRWLAK